MKLIFIVLFVAICKADLPDRFVLQIRSGFFSTSVAGGEEALEMKLLVDEIRNQNLIFGASVYQGKNQIWLATASVNYQYFPIYDGQTVTSDRINGFQVNRNVITQSGCP